MSAFFCPNWPITWQWIVAAIVGVLVGFMWGMFWAERRARREYDALYAKYEKAEGQAILYRPRDEITCVCRGNPYVKCTCQCAECRGRLVCVNIFGPG